MALRIVAFRNNSQTRYVCKTLLESCLKCKRANSQPDKQTEGQREDVRFPLNFLKK